MSEIDEYISSAARHDIVPVTLTMPAAGLTPLDAYVKLGAAARHSFLFESVEGGDIARYSFIGSGPASVVRGSGSKVEVLDASGTRHIDIGLYDYLRTRFGTKKVAGREALPPFIGGAIGYMDFDCVEWFEPKLRTGTHLGYAEFMVFDSVVVFDRQERVVWIISIVHRQGKSDAELRREFLAAVKRNRAVRSTLESNNAQGGPPPREGSREPTVRSNLTRPDFERSVSEIKERIHAGECYQVVLSQRFERRTGASPVEIFRALRSINPSPYMFILKTDGRSIIGASPEMLVRCQDSELEYRPIAGTRPRGRDGSEDDALAREMQHDAKEVAEHVMLVDLGRNDLGRVSKFGSVRVDRLMEVERYSHVQHLVSRLSSQLAPGCDRFDALAACFPAGTVSGAPKVRAIEIIRTLEPTPRGVYAGAVGYFDHGGNMDMCIAIRTIVLSGGVAAIQAGAGVVADSVPQAEYQETVNKARAMITAIDIAERVRTNE